MAEGAGWQVAEPPSAAELAELQQAVREFGIERQRLPSENQDLMTRTDGLRRRPDHERQFHANTLGQRELLLRAPESDTGERPWWRRWFSQ